MLVIPIELVGFECFKLDGEVAKILKPQFPEIIATDPDIEIFAPIVLDRSYVILRPGSKSLMRYGPDPSGGSSVVAATSRP
jgi:hypothetical protein